MFRRFIGLLVALIVLITGIVSCGGETLTVVATSVPLVFPGWEDVTLNSINLVVNEPGDFHESELITQTATRLSARMGIEVAETATAEVTLTINQNGNETEVPYEEVDSGDPVTLSGAETEIEVTLSKAGCDTITGNEYDKKTPGYRVAPGEKRHVDAREVIIPALIGAMADIWSDYLPIAALKDNDEYVRECGAEELTTLYTENATMTPAPESATLLLDIWQNDNSDPVRYAAYDAIIALGPRGAELIPTLLEMILPTEDDTMIIGLNPQQTEVGKIIANMGPTAVPYLIQLTKHESANMRSYAIKSLGESNINYPEVIQALTGGLRDESAYTVEVAAEFLLEKKPEVVFPALVEIIEDRNASVITRANAVNTLARLWQDEADLVIPVLLEAVQDSEEDAAVRNQLLYSLVNLGPESYDTVVPIMIECLESGDMNVRYSVVMDLKMIGPAALEAVPSLIEAMKNETFDDGKSIFAETLNAITGEDFGNDTDKWQQWWEGQ